MAVTVAAAAVALLATGGAGPARRRLGTVLPGRAATRPTRFGAVRLPPALEARLPVTGAVAAAGLVLAGHDVVGVPLLLAVGLTAGPQLRRRTAEAGRAAAVARDLPRAADLLATCLSAGLAPADAVAVVGDVVGGPVAEALRPVSAALRAGADPATAWRRVGEGDAAGGLLPGSQAPLLRLSRAFARASVTGAPLADTLSGLADDERQRARWAAEASVRRSAVRAVGPLAVCFLPAFLLLGVVPVVAGVAAEVLGRLR